MQNSYLDNFTFFMVLQMKTLVAPQHVNMRKNWIHETKILVHKPIFREVQLLFLSKKKILIKNLKGESNMPLEEAHDFNLVIRYKENLKVQSLQIHPSLVETIRAMEWACYGMKPDGMADQQSIFKTS